MFKSLQRPLKRWVGIPQPLSPCVSINEYGLGELIHNQFRLAGNIGLFISSESLSEVSFYGSTIVYTILDINDIIPIVKDSILYD